MLEAEATRCMTQGRPHLGLSLFCRPKVKREKSKGWQREQLPTEEKKRYELHLTKSREALSKPGARE